MIRPNLNIKEKLLFLIIFLISLVSFLIIIINNRLTESSRDLLLAKITGKITEVQNLSEQEFASFRSVVNEGILETSGLMAIENIASITLKHQNEFYNVVQDEISRVGKEVSDTLDSQHHTMQTGLKLLLKDSTDVMDDIIDFDNQSLSMLSNVAVFNVDTLKEASNESLEIFSRNNKEMDDLLNDLQEKNKHDIDTLLAETVIAMDRLKGAGLVQYLISRFQELKDSSDKRKDLARGRMRQEFDQQSKVMSEVMKIVTGKVNLAINNEQNNIEIIQKQKREEIHTRLLKDDTIIQEEIKKSTERVNQSLGQLLTDLPLQLKEKGKDTNDTIEKQIQNMQQVAMGAKDKVGRQVDLSNKNALERIKNAVDESDKVIERTFKDTSRTTLVMGVMVTVLCVFFAIILGIYLVQNITDPLTEVMQFAAKISKRQSVARLPEGADELGRMGTALNTMADELDKLEEATQNSFNQTLDQVIDCVFMFDPESLKFSFVNKGAVNQTGYGKEELLQLSPPDISPELSPESFREIISPLSRGEKDSLTIKTFHRKKDGTDIPVEILLKYVVPPTGPGRYIEIVQDMTELEKAAMEKEKLQSQLLHAQKLESVGQLAAGIAHEINTPMQFIGTNMEFLEEASKGMADLTKSLQRIMAQAPDDIAQDLQSALDETDWEFLIEEVPSAIRQSKDGISRVTSIVKAMKDFSHPSSREKEKIVVNSIIETTALIARNEWKYVSELKTDLAADLPPAPCLIDEMGQVILNLIVNAAQAIGEKLGNHPENEKGEILISTRLIDSQVEIRISDTGPGIPPAIQNRIFDPFFTTKEVGKGTGQGLAISHDVITKKHGGTLTFETSAGKGTTFIIRLPTAG
jgi:PAS domain S-box-containing protein